MSAWPPGAHDLGRAAALKKGDVDIVYLLSGPVAEEIQRTPGLRLVAAQPPGVFWLDFPQQWDPKATGRTGPRVHRNDCR